MTGMIALFITVIVCFKLDKRNDSSNDNFEKQMSAESEIS